MANPNVQVVLPKSLVPDEPHFTVQNYTDDTEGRVSALPLTWPINENLALHENSRTDFYDEADKTTPFDAFVAFLAYLVSQNDSIREQGISNLRLEETVMEAFSLIPRVRISLEFERATSLGLMYVHKNMTFSDKADKDVDYNGPEIQMQAYDTTPTFVCGVFSASFVHVCETKSGLPLLLDLALHDIHGKVVFRTPCLPYVYGVTHSPVILNFLRLGPVARMFCSDNAEEKKKAQQVAHTLFAYKSLGDIDDPFLCDDWRHYGLNSTMFLFLYPSDDHETNDEVELFADYYESLGEPV
ncbi:hypothetical protein CYMTET_38964 [Cymbomonas tetramitiformis]|uniref:Uncharacterized protein n=1 Tax=Cymbomonas tetramitiformis TaxID=36881 RepID=A0AAE0CC49_9CHLO|nr:hypothetical protein CYMTET_38964 [Cymbomonas tetramitiformis]